MPKLKNDAEKILHNKVYVPLGKVPIRRGDGTVGTEERHLIMSELQAKLTGATYTKKIPAPITVKKKGGGTFTREVPLQVTRVRYKLHYLSGTKRVTVNGKSRISPVFSTVPLTIPSGMSFKQILQIVRTKWKKKPTHVETPSGLKTRFINLK
jgi:hypothetical protein